MVNAVGLRFGSLRACFEPARVGFGLGDNWPNIGNTQSYVDYALCPTVRHRWVLVLRSSTCPRPGSSKVPGLPGMWVLYTRGSGIWDSGIRVFPGPGCTRNPGKRGPAYTQDPVLAATWVYPGDGYTLSRVATHPKRWGTSPPCLLNGRGPIWAVWIPKSKMSNPML